jgi:hypothetical protein
MAAPRRDPNDYLPSVEDVTGRVCGALSAVIDDSQIGSVETILRAALDGMNNSFINYRLVTLENKLRRKNLRLQAEREKNHELKSRLRHHPAKSTKKKIAASDLPLALPSA